MSTSGYSLYSFFFTLARANSFDSWGTSIGTVEFTIRIRVKITVFSKYSRLYYIHYARIHKKESLYRINFVDIHILI
jgi:hypothetical protein